MKCAMSWLPSTSVALATRPRAYQLRVGESHMTSVDFKKALTSTDEIEITVTGRRSGRPVSLPVWHVHEGGTLYLLPVRGSDSHWYQNILPNPSMTISAGGTAVTVTPRPITNPNKVREVVEKFRAKYGAAN